MVNILGLQVKGMAMVKAASHLVAGIALTFLGMRAVLSHCTGQARCRVRVTDNAMGMLAIGIWKHPRGAGDVPW